MEQAAMTFCCKRFKKAIISKRTGKKGIRVLVVESDDARAPVGLYLRLFDGWHSSRSSLRWEPEGTLITVKLTAASGEPLKAGEALYNGTDFDIIRKQLSGKLPRNVVIEAMNSVNQSINK